MPNINNKKVQLFNVSSAEQNENENENESGNLIRRPLGNPNL